MPVLYQPVNVLYQSLPKAVSTDDQSAIIVLDSSCNDLRRGCRAAIDHDDERYILNGATTSLHAAEITLSAAFDLNNRLARRDKFADDGDRLLKNAAWIASKVEN